MVNGKGSSPHIPMAVNLIRPGRLWTWGGTESANAVLPLWCPPGAFNQEAAAFVMEKEESARFLPFACDSSTRQRI